MKSGFRAKRYVRSVHRATARIECSRIISSREIYGLFISTTGGTAGVKPHPGQCPPSSQSIARSYLLMIANNLGDHPLTEFADRYNKFRGSLFLLFWSFRLFLLRAARANPARDRHKHSLVDLFLQNATRPEVTLRADAPNDDANAIKHNQNIQTPEIEMFSSLSRRALASIFQFIIDL